MLYLIGIGLRSPEDITLRGLHCLQQCAAVYLEGYTSIMGCHAEDLSRFYGKTVTVLDRPHVESDFLLTEAASKDVALLIVGDPFCATTHSSLVLEARERGISVEVVHNASILTAIGETGLSLYKFGRVVSLPFDQLPDSVYDAIRDNQQCGLHTLCLLDIRMEHGKLMTVNTACSLLLALEEKRKQGLLHPATVVMGIARIGGHDQRIISGTLTQLQKADFGEPPHCLIIPSPKRHFVEDSWIQRWKI
ncbi:diphthine synthase [Candidatus Woesearchaeota archaeon]|nr:diphthine synthase [Candidatus Woesearchaeota archaeon]